MTEKKPNPKDWMCYVNIGNGVMAWLTREELNEMAEDREAFFRKRQEAADLEAREIEELLAAGREAEVLSMLTGMSVEFCEESLNRSPTAKTEFREGLLSRESVRFIGQPI